MMEHEETFSWMMDALDGRIAEGDRSRLRAHLAHCQPCAREWAALQAIHQLFSQAPAMAPAADFVQRTVARLPVTRHRVWILGTVYVTLLVAGFVPLATLVWLGIQYGPALGQPALVRSLVQTGENVLDVGRVVLAGSLQGLSSFGNVIGQQPALAGWLLVMLGVIFLWGGIYRQLTMPRRTTNPMASR